ncbi:VOC family protein [Xylanimonas protaetiae]|uniref:VOC family protein n=1 Tax=Xylanimonas protaetiae TaxID=2509457 RepID=A0A4P6F2R6_9MICO|nr:VOC family protein [Xylanimonas protaetiae]QAY69465.1 VOC family protein [Xylanimonas protaetiae]
MLRISDLTYLVRDLDEAITFFVDALGFEVRSDEVSPGRRRVVVGPDGGGPGLVLKPAPSSPQVGRQADGGVLFFLHTDDFDATYARLAAHGVTFREEPRHEPWGTVVVFEDLYGQPWDLIQPLA